MEQRRESKARGREQGVDLYAGVRDTGTIPPTRNARRVNFPINPAHGIAKELFTHLKESRGCVSGKQNF